MKRTDDKIEVLGFSGQVRGYISPKEYVLLNGLEEFSHEAKVIYYNERWCRIRIFVEHDNMNILQQIKNELDYMHGPSILSYKKKT